MRFNFHFAKCYFCAGSCLSWTESEYFCYTARRADHSSGPSRAIFSRGWAAGLAASHNGWPLP